MHFKTALSKKHLNIAPPKNTFKKNNSKLLPQKMYFKNICQIAPSKQLPQKMYFKNTCQIVMAKIFFVSASIKAVKNKADINKSLIMHD